MSNSSKKKSKRCCGGGRSAAHPALESQLFEWFQAERKERRIINYRSLREKAQELRNHLSISDDFEM